ncbi:MAG: 8-oxo-dGTP diphosphatase [Miltoncostaeaceae bacterium]|nr:8-oxo-dGTP diphosphatase [Miltoncostaeaceae bacterium]
MVAALIERGGRVLIGRRPASASHGGLWEFPGGKRERGEDDRDALARELREELGVELEPGEVVWTAIAGALELRFLRCPWAPGQRPRPIGCEQFRWVRRADLPGHRFPPADAGFVRALAAGGLPPPGRGGAFAGGIESSVRRAEVVMAKAKRQRRTSIRTMQADNALEALELLERAEASRADTDEKAPEVAAAATAPPDREQEA